MRACFAAAVVAFFLSPLAYGTGFLMPDDARWGGLELESHRVTVDIRDQSARTKVVEVFRNQHSAQLEATFVFPLPKGATVSDFKMYVNGRLVTGEIMEAGSARQVYEDIVRRMRDPGLLEYMDSRLLKLRVFPIPKGSSQEVQITYNETLQAADGLVEYVYPLRTPQACGRTMKDFTLTVNIAASAGIKNVYSPTHGISVHNEDDRHVTAGFEEAGAALDRDFTLFYELSDKDFGAALIDEWPGSGDGYFMLLLSPKINFEADEIAAKDVVFVLDTSGSMKGEKIAQAKKALAFCVNALADKDRFNILPFGISVDRFSRDLSDATATNRGMAAEFIDRIQANGGTNIDAALQAALAMRSDDERPFVIVFLTDGMPTVGETQPEKILAGVQKLNKAGTRIFSFGVGYDVNAKLLDELSQTTKGATQYVEPGGDIEVKVSSFFKQMGDPVLSRIDIDYGNAGVYDIYPPQTGDLFRGGQVIVTGRYRHPGHSTITVKGQGPKGALVFEYPVDFAESGGKTEFVSSVWAGRKITYLLGEIRLHGENSELKEEVIRLSKQFGIVTPYTSYLVTEGSPVARPMPVPMHRQHGGGRIDGPGVSPQMSAQPTEARMERRRASSAETARLKSLGYIDGSVAGSAAPAAALAPSGAAAVQASVAYNELLTDAKADKGRLMQSAGGRTFVNIDGVWVDESAKDSQKTVKVKFGSPEYFRIYEKAGKLKAAFALGERIVISIGNWRLVVTDEEPDKASIDSLDAVLKALEAQK